MRTTIFAAFLLSISAICAPMAFLPFDTAASDTTAVAPLLSVHSAASRQTEAAADTDTVTTAVLLNTDSTAAVTTAAESGESTEALIDRSLSIGVEQDGILVAMTLEDYLCATVAAEMPASFPAAALEAQAIAARTLVLARLAGTACHDTGALVCTDYHHCAAFCDFSALSDENAAAVRQAVNATDGQVLLYDGEPITAAFHAVSGGMTEASVDVWGGELPYLTNVESLYEESAPNYQTEKTFSAAEFAECLSKAYSKTDFSKPIAQWFADSKRSAAGGILSVEVGGVRIAGTALRSLLGLASTDFTVTTDDTAQTLTFTCIGYGHGVGMSQYGAAGYAANGWSAAEIVAHYYPGTVLVSGLEVWQTFAD